MSRRWIPAFVLLTLAACQREAPPVTVGDRVARIETRLPPPFTIRGEPVEHASIEQRMRELNVPGVSVAVVNDGRIEWARGYGFADAEAQRPVTPNTLFQAASISKPVAALAALRLVESGRIDLDGDVNQWLTSWKVPENGFTAVEKVTLRRLLTHTAGTTVWGFPGYGPDETVPGAVGVLEGKGNTEPVVPFQAPGSGQRYSGGGYTVMQLLVADVTGRPFADVMRDEVLAPIGMARSTYEQPIPPDRQDDIAIGYRPDGSRVDGNWHTYPEQAAAGLWTTPGDLALYALEVQRALRGESAAVISQAMAREMVSEQAPGQGLGPAIDSRGPVFRHGGSNEGFRSGFFAYVDEGRGAFVMTNSDNGGALASQVLLAIAQEYGWPVPAPDERVPITLDRSALERWAGRYDIRADQAAVIALAVESDTLRARLPDGTVFTLVPESDSTFFERGEGFRAAFQAVGDTTFLRVAGITATRAAQR